MGEIKMRLRRPKLKDSKAGMIVGGIVIGAMASRLLPPILATVSGTVRARLGADPFKILENDHRTLETLLDKLRNSPDDSRAGRAAAFLALKRKLGKHALAEEDIIYPLLSEQAHAVDEAKRLYAEHAQMKIHMYELESSLTANGMWRDRIRALDELIRSHARDEEEKEFPRLREMLDEQRARTVSGLIYREEALVL